MTQLAGRFAVDGIADILARHIPLYRWRRPVYQTAMINGLAALWQGPHDNLLDVGGGTGIIAETMQQLFAPVRVTAVDVEDRFLESLSIDHRTYDGRTLPFADGRFDAATINNVLHHVRVEDRIPLMREVRRVVRGPVYIKDHVSTGALDRARLVALDVMGNLIFKGMLEAHYLSPADWEALAAAAGYRCEARSVQVYRRGPSAVIFPNRLETVMRWAPAG